MIVGHPKEAGGRVCCRRAPVDLKISGAVVAEPVARAGAGVAEVEAGVVEQVDMGSWTCLAVYDPSLPMVWFQVVLPVGTAMSCGAGWPGEPDRRDARAARSPFLAKTSITF